jgi:histidine triad (HIT) family protein
MINMDECVFCSIVRGKREAALVYRDEDFTVFMDKYPISTGHTLVIPNKHYTTILDMPSNEFSMLFALVHKVALAVMLAVNAQGFSIAQNNGRVAHQVVPHVHVHIVPRFSTDDDKSKYASRRIATLDELRSIADRIKSHLTTLDTSNINIKIIV